jgi:hypothetical protein
MNLCIGHVLDHDEAICPYCVIEETNSKLKEAESKMEQMKKYIDILVKASKEE